MVSLDDPDAASAVPLPKKTQTKTTAHVNTSPKTTRPRVVRTIEAGAGSVVFKGEPSANSNMCTIYSTGMATRPIHFEHVFDSCRILS